MRRDATRQTDVALTRDGVCGRLVYVVCVGAAAAGCRPAGRTRVCCLVKAADAAAAAGVARAVAPSHATTSFVAGTLTNAGNACHHGNGPEGFDDCCCCCCCCWTDRSWLGAPPAAQLISARAAGRAGGPAGGRYCGSASISAQRTGLAGRRRTCRLHCPFIMLT